MNIDLPTQYDPKSVEAAIYQKWLVANSFHAIRDARTNKFSIVIPPPNVTGALHLGHAINGTIQDVLIRYHRMKGDNTLWMPGIDHAGIATQAVVEKTIFEKEKKSRHDLGREELVRRIWEWKEQFGTRILNQLQSIGLSCDWDRARFTLDDICAKAVREAFFKMFKDGLIFRGKRLVNWDAHLQTAVADDEIYHETVKGQMTSIKYPVSNPGVPPASPAGDPPAQEYLIVATTRPETMLADTALAVHPDDPRYQHLIGKHVIIPLVGRKIPIIADGLLVDPAFGTGVVKVTPAHDPNDYATGLRHNLEQINLLTPDGKMNENGQGDFLGKHYSYTGLKFATAARKQILADLESLGLIADHKPHEHEVGHSDRSKTPIEPYLSDQWFVRMGDISNAGVPPASEAPHGNAVADAPTGITLANGTTAPGLAQAAIDAVTSNRVKITPDRYAKGYIDWLSQKRDWCISRQLWWGHRIPVWKVTNYPGPFNISWSPDTRKGEVIKDQSGVEIALQHRREGDAKVTYICIPPGHPEIESLLGPACVRDPDVLDTWFSSALWPLSTMGWPPSDTEQSEPRPLGSGLTLRTPQPLPHSRGSDGMPPEPELLPYFYPTSVLSTAREILTLWVARMVIFGLYLHGEVPFKNVYIHAVIQDGEGRPMKKSLGNGVDPVDIVNSHGADALRFTLASMATETQDIRMPVTKDAAGHNTSPKFDLGRNFANKIWNASRFILANIDEKNAGAPHGNAVVNASHLEDRWILSRLHSTIQTVTASINNYKFAELADSLRTFFWTDLCDWYLEIAKPRIKSGGGGDTTVQQILLHTLRTSLQLLHPLMPFITEELWSKFPSPGIAIPGSTLLITSPFPIADPSLLDPAAESQLALIQSLTTAIREIQNRYPAAKGKPTILQPKTPALQSLIEQSRTIIETLASTHIAENSPTAQKPENAASTLLPGGECQIFIPGVIDKAVESAKLTKRKLELQKLIDTNRNKLGNEPFVQKAPAKIIQGLRDQLARYEEELAATESTLAEL